MNISLSKTISLKSDTIKATFAVYKKYVYKSFKAKPPFKKEVCLTSVKTD